MKFFKYLFLLIFIGIIGFVVYSLYFYTEEKEVNKVLIKTENILANLNNYFIYGKCLNVEGNINIDYAIKDIKFVLKTSNNEIEYDLIYKVNDNEIDFKISDEINNSIDLDKIEIGNYYVLIKTIDNDDNIKYYSIENKTEYTNNEYYTVTKNDNNNKILIDFGKTEIDGNYKRYMSLKVKKVKLPENIYDIVIDPGHGGKDSGAVIDDYYESDITLEYGKLLKKALEELGLKVKLTRDGINEEDLGIYDVYGKDGRAVIPNNVKAKYTLSIHLNSLPYKIKNGGVEIYAPTKSNLDFAKMLADNIVESAKTTYSQGETFKELDGVYVRYFTEDDIKISTSNAHSSGYEPYDIKPDTPYYFMIRETGGIATNAYVDGRNEEYEGNPYYKSNNGSETYLLELGYMVCDNDFENILNNKASYVEGIAKAIKDYLEL